jgi:hypothetical protein
MKKFLDNHQATFGLRMPIIIKLSKRYLLSWCVMSMLVMLSTVVDGALADENDSRRVDISLSIFPRIIAVDNHFREKLNSDKEAYLLFVYDNNEEYARQLAARMKKGNTNIGGMRVVVEAMSINEEFLPEDVPTALFVVERLTDAQLEKVMAFANETHRLVFSPYLGDVERGVTVGISVTNRVKPYFNLSSLRESKVSINALLMKMSKRHE